MRCPKCNYNNLDGSAVCNLCGALLHHEGHQYHRPAQAKPKGPPAPYGPDADPGPLQPALREIRHCIVCFPLDPVKLDKARMYEIGRSKKCSIILPVGQVSRHHARIQWQDRHFAIMDLQSHNGTFINGEAVKEHPLRNRDQIKIGPYLLDYYVYAGNTELVGSQGEEMDQTKDITIGDPTKNVNTFRGNVAEMALGEIMQLLNLTRKSGNLVIRSKDREGTVFFRNGEIVHALWGSQGGEEAIARIVLIHEGTFKFSLNDGEVSRTIQQKTSKLLVEALRNARRSW